MKFNKILMATAMASTLALTTASCSDDYKELNVNPSTVSQTDPKGLMAQAVLKFQPYDYLIWYYNVSLYTNWDQMGIPTSGYTEAYTEQGSVGGVGSQYLETLKYRNKIRNAIDYSGDETQRGYEAACTAMTVYLGIHDSDIYGALPYKDACQYETDPSKIIVDYDMVEDLYNYWLEELDQAIKYFTASDVESSITEDVPYGGDWSKWAKFANSLKLKIAVRLLVQNKAKAFEIAQAVANSSVGYMDSLEDDFRFCKATKSNSNGNDDYVYGTGNGLSSPGLTKNVCDFMKGSKDPRIRFIYTKNSLNSKVINGFIEAGKYENLPEEIRRDIVLGADGKFKEWGGMGEPWVRYQGLPVVMNGKIKDDYKSYFNYGTDYNLNVEEADKTYYPFSYQTSEMKKGRTDFTIPTLGKTVIEDTDDNPLYVMYMTAAEVNLYLAEFKALGCSLPQSVEYYYNRGVRFSVETYDALAGANKIPYYGKTYDYDPNEVSIELKAGELDAMMATDNVKLSAGNTIEKIYLQELMHFSLMPQDQYVTARRSGYPKIGSTLLPFVKFNEIALTGIPRRFEIGNPSATDKMKDKMAEAYKKQGFNTLGSGLSGGSYNLNGTCLNTERLWQDIGAPQWGTPAQ